MTTNHTPGPWRIGKAHGAVVADVPVNAGLDNDHVEAYGGHLIAESIAVCNRPLIAAAPELLRAAVRYLNALDTWDGSRKAERHTERMESELRAAVAKAKGEQQ
ncbi:hypothetical protein LMG3482_01881 [Achromobacter deleyi]|uniref:hypothetical protein n=1 Tax=Achromobacter deleyi TaxID=1353891 RepID=UPI001466BFEA|nr:hypothetical protein [Achromobacter deleyi]CAB3846181.1 hypothetical protein LMG3481_01518 [Achromobacter deleyi]CAB3853254.1 hypothetical protein LMG3482_01881 [Achromobacter deleyi]